MTNWCSLYSQNTMVSLEYIDFWPKILLFRTHHLWNSTIELILLFTQVSWNYLKIVYPNLKNRMQESGERVRNAKRHIHLHFTWVAIFHHTTTINTKSTVWDLYINSSHLSMYGCFKTYCINPYITSLQLPNLSRMGT